VLEGLAGGSIGQSKPPIIVGQALPGTATTQQHSGNGGAHRAHHSVALSVGALLGAAVMVKALPENPLHTTPAMPPTTAVASAHPPFGRSACLARRRLATRTPARLPRL
jgi:hypothetical protein